VEQKETEDDLGAQTELQPGRRSTAREREAATHGAVTGQAHDTVFVITSLLHSKTMPPV
jgi:hypothetical protein